MAATISWLNNDIRPTEASWHHLIWLITFIWDWKLRRDIRKQQKLISVIPVICKSLVLILSWFSLDFLQSSIRFSSKDLYIWNKPSYCIYGYRQRYIDIDLQTHKQTPTDRYTKLDLLTQVFLLLDTQMVVFATLSLVHRNNMYINISEHIALTIYSMGNCGSVLGRIWWSSKLHILKLIVIYKGKFVRT